MNRPLLFTFLLALSLSKINDGKPICENVCKCASSPIEENTTTVDCSRTYLRVVPNVDDWPMHARELDLSFNNITALEVAFTHEYIKVLKLNQNKIQTVKPSVFSGLSNLEHLDLSYNSLEQIEDSTFHGLTNLLTLNLSHNKIRAINDFTFSGLLLMQDLSLSSNKIIHVQNSHWNRMYELSKLDLSGIGAYFFEANLFHGLDKLERLDISRNDFDKVPTMALRSAKNLKWLKLNENPIHTVDKESFLRLESLTSLEMSFMKNLETVGPGAFSELTNLTYLEVSSNSRLKSLSSEAFKNLFGEGIETKLQVMKFQFNRLSTLTPLPCYNKQEINLQGNPWNCDCRLRWIKKCFIPEVYASDLKCYYPQNLRGHLITSIAEDLFSCNIEQSEPFEDVHNTNNLMRATTFAFGFIVLAMLAVLMVSVFKWRSIRGWWRNRKRGPGAVYYVRARANPVET